MWINHDFTYVDGVVLVELKENKENNMNNKPKKDAADAILYFMVFFICAWAFSTVWNFLQGWLFPNAPVMNIWVGAAFVIVLGTLTRYGRKLVHGNKDTDDEN